MKNKKVKTFFKKKWIFLSVILLISLALFLSAEGEGEWVWMNLSGNDTDNWVGISIVPSLTVNPNDNLVYTGLDDGKFGVYNHSNGVWMNLSGNDTGNWVGTSLIHYMDVNPNDNLVYTGLDDGKFGVYNHSNGVWMDLSGNDTGDWAGISKVFSIAVNVNDNLVYTGLDDGKFGVYNHSNGVWMDLSGNDTGDWAGGTSFQDIAINPNNNLIYTGLSAGKFGVYNHSNGVWMNLSGNDTDNWVGDTNLNGMDINPNDNLVYTGLVDGKFGVYNHSNGVWMNLSGNDTGDWAGNKGLREVAVNPNDNLVYTGLVDGRFGVYNHSNGVWMNLSGNDTDNWVGATEVASVRVNPNDNLVYTVLYSGKFGVYFYSTPTLSVSPPNITALNQYPLNGTAYSSTQFYSFNATIVNNNNDVDDVRFEFNNINYTPVNTTANPTIFNITLPIQLGTGVYTYRWIANDSSNNKNVTTNYTTVINATSVVNLTLNDFDRNITVQAGKTIYINATLLTGAYSGANLNLTMNGTQINYSDGGKNISHTIIINKRESGINFTIFYSGNQNFSASTETWFLELAGTNVTLINPYNGTNSTGLSYTFGANGSTTEGVLANSTLYIWNSTGGRVFDETNIESGVSAIRNVTYIFPNIQATFQDYKWNYYFCNNESSCAFSEKNYSFTIYSNGEINSLSETRYILAENTSIEAYVVQPSTGLDYCNFTVRIPSGANIINNVNGSINGNIWNSSSFFINETGQHQMNITCRDSKLNNLISRQANFTANYSIAYSPVNISLSAQEFRNETNKFNITLFDNSIGEIRYNFTYAIMNSSDFTISFTKLNVTLNSTDNQTNVMRTEVSINASNNIGNGTYDGNITFRNSTYGRTYIIFFKYGINPPAGMPSVYKTNPLTKCSSEFSSICTKDVDLTQGGGLSVSFKVINDGFAELKGCRPRMSNDFDGLSWVNFSQSSFDLTENSSTDITISFSTLSSTPVNDYRGYFYSECDSSNLLDENVSTEPDNRPYIRINLLPLISVSPNPNTGGGGGGGGGAGEGVKNLIPVVAVKTEANYSDLERAIIYSRLYWYLKDGNRPTNNQKLETQSNLSGLGIGLDFSIQEIDGFIEDIIANKIYNYDEDKINAEFYNLIQSVLVFEAERFEVSPREYIKTEYINFKKSHNYTILITANEALNSCEVISGDVICKIISPTQAGIIYQFKESNLFVIPLKGEVRFTSKFDNIDRTRFQVNLVNSGYEITLAGLKMRALYLIIGAIILLILLSLYLYFRKQRKRGVKFREIVTSSPT